jgi:hypothetical protein
MNNHGFFASGGPWRALALAAALAAALAPGPAPAANATGEGGAPAQSVRPAPGPRSFGTGSGDIQVGRDPETGAEVIRVTPAPREEPRYDVPPVEVRPEIHWPPQKK